MARDRHENGGQGMNWIRQERRLAIYLRDGLACAYCGATIEDGARLTLDHLKPYSRSLTPDNTAGNLVTCCHRCNSSRGNRPWRAFAATVAEYLDHGMLAETIIAHIARTRKRVLDVGAAKEIISRRGFAAATQGEKS